MFKLLSCSENVGDFFLQIYEISYIIKNCVTNNETTVHFMCLNPKNKIVIIYTIQS